MHIIQEEIGLPKIKVDEKSTFAATFTIDPLPSGYGMTLGNALRRVLLSSLPGAAVVAVKIVGASHEYSTLSGVRDTVLDIILNLKQLHLKKHTKGREIAKIEVKGEGEVKASQIQVSSDVEVLNPDHVITVLDRKDVNFSMEIVIDKGVGYLPASVKQRKDEDIGPGFILVDAIFSPVRKVRYDVKATRVGQRTDLDKLIIEIETNGSMSPEDTLKFSTEVLRSYFELFNKEEQAVESEFMSNFSNIVAQEEEEEQKRESYTPIEILNLSPRTLNALINGGLGSIEQLVKCSPGKLTNFRGFGRKAMQEVQDALRARGMDLCDDGEDLGALDMAA